VSRGKGRAQFAGREEGQNSIPICAQVGGGAPILERPWAGCNSRGPPARFMGPKGGSFVSKWAHNGASINWIALGGRLGGASWAPIGRRKTGTTNERYHQHQHAR